MGCFQSVCGFIVDVSSGEEDEVEEPVQQDEETKEIRVVNTAAYVSKSMHYLGILECRLDIQVIHDNFEK